MKKKTLLTFCVIASLVTQSLPQVTYASETETPLFSFKSYNFENGEVEYDSSKPILINAGGPQVTIPNNYVPSKEEFRSTWVATVFNIDISAVSGTGMSSEDVLKAKYLEILEQHKRYNLNTVTFQVSSMLDAYYPSDLAPWSQFLHLDSSYSNQGKDPGFGDFDPLAWMIEETHKNGMEFHAWFNPYRVTNNVDLRSKEEKLNELAANNFARLNPDLVYEFQNKLFLDPGRPEVIDYVVNRVAEVASKYDVDAIHFDDYFYPYKYSGKDSNGNTVDIFFHQQDLDKQTFEDYNRGFGEYNTENAAKWRENNINLLIEAVSKKISEINNMENRAIQYGISPFGIWGHSADGGQYEKGSKTPIGSTSSLRDQFANTKLWAENGWIDYLTPQIYWAFNTPAAPYGELLQWWDAQFNSISNTHLYIGHPNYKHIDASWDANFKNPVEIPNQLKFNQKFSNVKGSAFFSLAKLKDAQVITPGDKFNVLNESNRIIREEYYNFPANAPARPWLDKFETYGVETVAYDIMESGNKISWLDKNTDSRFYVVYRQEGSLDSIDISDPSNIIDRIGVSLGSEYIDLSADPSKSYTYAVTVIDDAGIETEPSIFNKESMDLLNYAEEIIAMIESLPDIDSLGLVDEEQVITVREVVNDFSSPELIINIEKLELLEDRIIELKVSSEKVQAAIYAIDKLPEVSLITLDHEEDIANARKLVDIANNDGSITNLAKLLEAESIIAELKSEFEKTQAAINAINSLPEVSLITLDHEEDVKNARKLVDIANNDGSITNLAKLLEAENKIDTLKNIENNEDEEDTKETVGSNNNGNLPQTGAATSTISLLIGQILTTLGVLILRKKKTTL